MEEKNYKIVRGLCDLYKVYRSIDAINGNEVLEVSRLYEVDKGLYDEVPLGEIDGNFNDTNEMLLDEIDARFNTAKKDMLLS